MSVKFFYGDLVVNSVNGNVEMSWHYFPLVSVVVTNASKAMRKVRWSDRELEEAAMVDGSSRLRAFFTVTLPLVAPGLVATGIFAFIQAWNEFTFALVIMDRPDKETLPV